MKRALIIAVVAVAAFTFALADVANAGGFSIRIGGYGHHHHGHYGSYHGGLFGHGYRGYRGSYFGSYYRPYRSYTFGSSYYPRSYFGYRSYYPSYGYGGFGCASNSFAYPGVVAVPVAPLYADASRAYGPDAVKDFLGVDRDFAKGAIAPQPRIIDVKPVERAIVGKGEAEERVASNAEARARAVRFVTFGDDKFGAQEYHSAAQRYRFAIEAAPDVAEAHFRQGFAYIASNRYDLAVKALRRGLQLDPMWASSDFRVDDLYAGNALAKGSHLDTLAKSALIDRGNADHFFLLGVMLHFDGQVERAKKFFERAERLAGEDDAHIKAFLVPPLPRAEDAI